MGLEGETTTFTRDGKGELMNIEKRRQIERRIARRVVKDGLAAGYKIGVDNGGDEFELPPSGNGTAILNAMFATDEEYLVFYMDGERVGSVYFVYGNDGWDVITDYSTCLEEVLKGANDLADRLSG